MQTQSAMDACYKAKEKGADVLKQWDAALDARTRESHAMVDGEIRELDKPFSNGLMFPGDPSSKAAEVVNCRCALLQRAKWALDEEELQVLKDRAAYFGLDKTHNFDEYKKNYLKAAENFDKPLTNKGNGDIMQLSNDASVFDGIVSNQIGMTVPYKTTLNQKYASGTDDAKKAFNKYVPNNSVADGAYIGTPHFSPATKNVYMNFADDMQNKRGAGTTFFHEHGHYIDFMAAGSTNYDYLSSSSQTFGAKLQSDFKEYVKSYKKQYNIKAEDAYRNISFELIGHDKHSLSDLIDGISKGKCSGIYGHKRSYWSNPGALEHEAFAHMYEAQFDGAKRDLMIKYFPNALEEFEKMIKGVI